MKAIIFTICILVTFKLAYSAVTGSQSEAPKVYNVPTAPTVVSKIHRYIYPVGVTLNKRDGRDGWDRPPAGGGDGPKPQSKEAFTNFVNTVKFIKNVVQPSLIVEDDDTVVDPNCEHPCCSVDRSDPDCYAWC